VYNKFERFREIMNYMQDLRWDLFRESLSKRDISNLDTTKPIPYPASSSQKNQTSISRRTFGKIAFSVIIGAVAAYAGYSLYQGESNPGSTTSSSGNTESGTKSTTTKHEYIPDPTVIKNKINILSYYLPSWGTKSDYKRSETLTIGSDFHPILGKYKPVDEAGTYSCADSEILDWQIKWALEHGISAFIFHYMYPGWNWELNLENGIKSSRFLDKFKFAINYNDTPHRTTTSNDERKTTEVMEHLCSHYFGHPSYLKIDNRPVVITFQSHIYASRFGIESLDNLIKVMRKTCEENGHEIYLIGDVMNNSWYPGINASLSRGFDAITSYNMPDAGSKFSANEKGQNVCVDSYDKLVDGYIRLWGEWLNLARKYKVKLVPPLLPGFSNKILYEGGYDDFLCDRKDSTQDKFRRMCEASAPYIDTELNTAITESWNEFQEGSVIEPTLEFGFDYIDTIREIFSSESPSNYPKNLIPTQEGIVEYIK